MPDTPSEPSVQDLFAARDARANLALIADELDLDYRRTVPGLERRHLARDAGADLQDDAIGWFVAGIMAEAVDGQGRRTYVAVAAAHTADLPDVELARRNAGLMQRFTNTPCRAVVACARWRDRVRDLVDAGDIAWHQLKDRVAAAARAEAAAEPLRVRSWGTRSLCCSAPPFPRLPGALVVLLGKEPSGPIRIPLPRRSVPVTGSGTRSSMRRDMLPMRTGLTMRTGLPARPTMQSQEVRRPPLHRCACRRRSWPGSACDDKNDLHRSTRVSAISRDSRSNSVRISSRRASTSSAGRFRSSLAADSIR